MQYIHSLSTRGIPLAPVPVSIPSANADAAAPTFCASGTIAAARLRPSRVSPRACVRSLLVQNHEVGAVLKDAASSSSNLVLVQSGAWIKDVEEHIVGSPPQSKFCIHSSPDQDEWDLEGMVQDFMENGVDEKSSAESTGTASADLKPSESLRAVVLKSTVLERELMSDIAMIVLSMSDQDLACHSILPSRTCRGRCIRRLLVEHLRLMKYNAAVCRTKLASAGEYELIDVIFDSGHGKLDRVIVDVDFRSQFEIARPTASYQAALRSIPVLFVGSSEKLSQVLHILAGAARSSLKKNAMPLPPWRTLSYMSSKWMSPCERLENQADDEVRGGMRARPTEQCAQELQYLKVCMSSGMATEEPT